MGNHTSERKCTANVPFPLAWPGVFFTSCPHRWNDEFMFENVGDASSAIHSPSLAGLESELCDRE